MLSMLELLWRPIKMTVFHQNESCLSCPHPPSSYEGKREQEGTLFVFQKDDSQQNVNNFLTPVFNVLLHGALRFALHGSSNIHFLIG